MTKTEAIRIYDQALKHSDSQSQWYASVAKYLANLNDIKRAEYLARYPNTKAGLFEFI